MAEVFRVRANGPHGFERQLVIKRMHRELQRDKTLVQMFADEAKLAACANHPNVVQVYELGQDESGEMFIVMEHVAGTDLKELQLRAYRNNKRIPAWFSVYVAIEVLDGLAFMHDLLDPNGRRRNVVHRDVSPENIFVSQLGEVKIGDFGIARDDTRPIDAYGHEVKGKTAYLAPEQLKGVTADQKFDVFSAGVVLWECLTQRPLFGAMTPNEMLAAIVNAPRIAPSRFVHDIPTELDGIVLRALTANPAERIATTRQLRDELARVLAKMHPGQIVEAELARVYDDLSSPDVRTHELSMEIDDEQILEQQTDAGYDAELDGALARELNALLSDDVESAVWEDTPAPAVEPAPAPSQKKIAELEEPDGRTYAIIRKQQKPSRGSPADARI